MLKLNLPNLKRVLCLGAHADDIEIGCGGTLLKLMAEHASLEVHWVVLGADGPRAEEARESARLFLGDSERHRIVAKGFRDSYFPYVGGEIKEYVEELRGSVSPDLIFTHRRDDLHQDHRVVSELTLCAFRDHVILEYEIPKYDGDMGRPSLYVPLERETCSRKVEAIMRAFPSQHDKPWFSEDTYWALMRLRGVECHSPSKFAEAFFPRKMML